MVKGQSKSREVEEGSAYAKLWSTEKAMRRALQ